MALFARQGTRLARVGVLASCLAAAGLAAAAGEPHAHVHGVAELHVAIDAAQLEVSLETPLDNVLGFEHPPSTDAQRAAVRKMAARLRQTQGLLVPTPAAKCTLSKVELASAALPPELLGEPKSAVQLAPDPDGHADLDASYAWTCAAPAELKGLDVGLISAFRGMRQINVQVIAPKGQSATQLTGAKRSITW